MDHDIDHLLDKLHNIDTAVEYVKKLERIQAQLLMLAKQDKRHLEYHHEVFKELLASLELRPELLAKLQDTLHRNHKHLAQLQEDILEVEATLESVEPMHHHEIRHTPTHAPHPAHQAHHRQHYTRSDNPHDKEEEKLQLRLEPEYLDADAEIPEPHAKHAPHPTHTPHQEEHGIGLFHEFHPPHPHFPHEKHSEGHAPELHAETETETEEFEIEAETPHLKRRPELRLEPYHLDKEK